MFRRFGLAPALVMMFSASCQESSSELNSVSVNSATFDTFLKRRARQTEYLTLNPEKQAPGGLETLKFSTRGRSAELADGGREIVTSDLFAVVPSESSDFELLYSHAQAGLLHYAISNDSKNGKPSIRSRALGSFVNPNVNVSQSLMYVDDLRKFAIIIEQNQETGRHQVSTYRYGSSEGGYLQTQELDGDVTDHRLLKDKNGSVLYVTGRKPLDNNNGQTSYVASFAVQDDGSFSKRDELTFPGVLTGGEVVNIIEAQVDGETRYFAIAPLSQYYDWSSGAPLDDSTPFTRRIRLAEGGIMLVDITSSEGKIGDAYRFPSQGHVHKLGNTSINSGVIEGVSAGSFYKSRAAVYERSALPKSRDTLVIVTEEEAKEKVQALSEAMEEALEDARKKLAQEALEQKRIKPEEVDTYQIHLPQKAALVSKLYGTLLESAGLKNVYTELTLGSRTMLSKVRSDFLEPIVGPMGANLKDVRYARELVLISWEPIHSIDPISIYHRGSAETSPRLLGIVPFQGVFQRTLPVFVKDDKGKEHLFVIGYGIDGSEKRLPMAKAFRLIPEAADDGGVAQYWPLPVGELAFGEEGLMLDARQHDRYTLFEYDEKSRVAYLLVQLSESPWIPRTGRYGAALLNFDFKKALAGVANSVESSGIISTSPVLTAPEGDAIQRLLALSPTRYDWLVDMDLVGSLGNNLTLFDLPLLGGAAGGASQRVVGLIELVRSVDAFTTIRRGSSEYGVQLVAKRLQDKDREFGLEPRLVPINSVDAPKDQALNNRSLGFLPGRLVGEPYRASNGDVVIVTRSSRTKKVRLPDGKEEDRAFTLFTASRLAVVGDAPDVNLQISQGQWETAFIPFSDNMLPYARPFYLPYPYDTQVDVDIAELKDHNGMLHFLITDGSDKVRLFENNWVQEVAFNGTNSVLAGGGDIKISGRKTSFSVVSGEVLLLTEETVEFVDQENRRTLGTEGALANGRVTFNSVARASYDSRNQLQLSGAVNIPGKPHALVKKKDRVFLLTDDRHLTNSAVIDRSERQAVEDGRIMTLTTVNWAASAEERSLALVEWVNNTAYYGDQRSVEGIRSGYFAALERGGREPGLPELQVMSEGDLIFVETKGESNLVKLRISDQVQFRTFRSYSLDYLESDATQGLEGRSSILRSLVRILEHPKTPGVYYAVFAVNGDKMDVMRFDNASTNIEAANVTAKNSRGFNENNGYIDFRRGAPQNRAQVSFSPGNGCLNIADSATLSVRQYQIEALGGD